MPETRPLYIIANEISKNWKPVHPTAVPYLNAMKALDKVTDNYGYDTGISIINYFLSNAATWRGDTAKTIKAELRAMVKTSRSS